MEVKNRIMYHVHVMGCYDDEWKVGNEITVDENFNSYFGEGSKNFDTCVTVGEKNELVSFDQFLKKRIDEFDKLDEDLKKRLLMTSKSIINNAATFTREMALELYRKEYHPDLPCRMNCIWLTNKTCLNYWKTQFKKYDLKLFKVEVSGTLFKSSDYYIPSKTLTFVEKCNAAKDYWNPKFDNNKSKRKVEYLFQGKLKILEEIK